MLFQGRYVKLQGLVLSLAFSLHLFSLPTAACSAFLELKCSSTDGSPCERLASVVAASQVVSVNPFDFDRI